MKKWQELFFSALFNISVALIAGGILKLVLDFSRILPAVVIVICGFYLLFVVTFMAKYIDERM